MALSVSFESLEEIIEGLGDVDGDGGDGGRRLVAKRRHVYDLDRLQICVLRD